MRQKYKMLLSRKLSKTNVTEMGGFSSCSFRWLTDTLQRLTVTSGKELLLEDIEPEIGRWVTTMTKTPPGRNA